MHNCFCLILAWIGCLNIFLKSNQIIQVNNVSYLIDSNMMYDVLNLDSVLEAGELGFSAIEIDKNALKKYVSSTLTNSFPQFDFQFYYYFYDAKTLRNCSLNPVPCNSVQIKIIIKYQDYKEERIFRYELKERSNIIQG